MERLSDGGMSMSQINVQRRMRPSISHFVRYELPSYRWLESESYALMQDNSIPQARGQRSCPSLSPRARYGEERLLLLTQQSGEL